MNDCRPRRDFDPASCALIVNRWIVGKEATKTEAEIAMLDKKLGNRQFLAKAPEEVVKEQRERKAELSRTLERLKAALERLTDE